MHLVGTAGYIAKGIIYGVVGVLALKTALGQGGSTEGSQGAVRLLARQPFGSILLIFLTIGLAAYVLLRLAQAVLDTEGKGRDAGGLARRAAYLVSALSYGGLTYLSLSLVISTGGGGSSASRQGLTASVLSTPFGQVVVAAVGFAIVAAGAYQMYQIWSGRYMRRYDTDAMSTQERHLARRTGQTGLAARGLVFGLIGIFVIQAALERDPGATGGLGEALGTLARQPYGPYHLGLTAAGLVCYAFYCFFRARYQRFDR